MNICTAGFFFFAHPRVCVRDVVIAPRVARRRGEERRGGVMKNIVVQHNAYETIRT